MTDSEAARPRGRPLVAFLAVMWVGLGFWAIEDGDIWRGAAGVLLGSLFFATYIWPDTALDRFLFAPIFRRKK